MNVFTIGALVLEYIGFKQFAVNVAIGIIIIIFAAAIGLIAFDIDLMYCGCGLNMVFYRKNKTEEVLDENSLDTQKSYKGWDIAVSIIGIVLIIGLLVGHF